MRAGRHVSAATGNYGPTSREGFGFRRFQAGRVHTDPPRLFVSRETSALLPSGYRSSRVYIVAGHYANGFMSAGGAVDTIQGGESFSRLQGIRCDVEGDFHFARPVIPFYVLSVLGYVVRPRFMDLARSSDIVAARSLCKREALG